MRVSGSNCLWLAAMLVWAQPPSETASVSGTVTHAITGVPILRAHIALRGAGPDAKNYDSLTTAEGKFSITGIVPGTYQVTADRVGFYMPAEPGGRAAMEAVLRAGDEKEGLKFRLAPLGSISGRVVDAEGEPVEGAAVAISTGPSYSGSGAVTTDTGRFRLGDLRPGKYRVRAFVPAALVTLPEVRTDGTSQVRYVPTYYGGVTDYKSAARIELGTGIELDGIEIRLVRAPMVRISGKVLGVPPGQRGVELAFSQTTSSPGISGFKNDGTFEVWNVDPGRYFLTARWVSGNQRVQTAPMEVEVGQSNIENVELRVIPPSDISGQIVFEDDEARPKPPRQNQNTQQASTRRPRVELRTVDPGMFAEPVASDVAEDGSFHLAGVKAARYRVMLSWASAYVKTVTLGSKVMDGNVLNLRNGAAGASLSVLLSSAFGAVSGTVTDGDAPVAGARVALLRDDFVSLGDVAFTNTDGAGSYVIANVRPGKYRIAAVEENDNGPRAGNLDDYEDTLARIEVGPKERLTQDLKRHPPVK